MMFTFPPQDVLRFWLEKDIDGWRLDGIEYLYEDTSFQDEEYLPGRNGSVNYNDMIHDKTANLPEVYDLMVIWRALADYYKQKTGRTR